MKTISILTSHSNKSAQCLWWRSALVWRTEELQQVRNPPHFRLISEQSQIMAVFTESVFLYSMTISVAQDLFPGNV